MYQAGITRLYVDMYAQTMPARALNNAVAAELTRLRTEAELSNRQVSDRTGIPEVSIQRYMAGTRAIKVDDLAAMAYALGSDPADIFRAAAARVHGKD